MLRGALARVVPSPFIWWRVAAPLRTPFRTTAMLSITLFSRKRLLAAGASALTLAFGACSDPITPIPPRPVQVPTRELQTATPHFLRLDPGAPTLAQKAVHMWVINGVQREVEIWYHLRAGQPDSTRFLRFRVDRRSLLLRPDGTPIAPGDSILITISIIDTVRQQVQFSPPGLRFAPGRPAKLWLWYLEADHDFNADGAIDPLDSAIEMLLGMYRLEAGATTWERIASALDTAEDEVQANVDGFTTYAVAY